jgi:hypothetical protein
MKIIALFLILLVASCGVDISRNELKRQNIKGVVIKKYTDNFNHAAHVLVYSAKEKTGFYSKELYGDENKLYVGRWEENSDLWSYVQVGDSLIKPPGSLLLLIKRKGEYVKIYHSQY